MRRRCCSARRSTGRSAQPGAYPNTAKKALSSRPRCRPATGSTASSTASSATRRSASHLRPGDGDLQWRAGALPGRRRHGRHLLVGCADHRAEDARLGDRASTSSWRAARPDTRATTSGAATSAARAPSPLQPTVTFLALGTVAPADPMPTSGAPYVGLLLDQWIKYAVTRDPNFHSLTLDPENPGAVGEPHQRAQHAARHQHRHLGIRDPRRQAAAGARHVRRARQHPRDRAVLPAAAGADGAGVRRHLRAVLRGRRASATP